MRSITYASTAVEPWTDDELVDMRARWVRRNKELDVTGMLLYGNGHLMQTIEGPDEAVTQLLDRIVDDERHHGIFVVINEPIAEREFPEWSMAFRHVGELVDAEGYSAFLDDSDVSEDTHDAVLTGGGSVSRRMLALFRSQWV
jgi:hypothetical protein